MRSVGTKCNFMVSYSQCVHFPLDDKCSATGEGQGGSCEANNNSPVLGDQRHVGFLFCFVFHFHEQCSSLKKIFFLQKTVLLNITNSQVCILLKMT